jgi:hypothetical protein
MDNIPLEILEAILLNLDHTHQNNERFPTLTRISRRSILSARTIWGAYRTSKPLRLLFVGALEETPFVVSGPEDTRGWISGLDALSRSKYARDLTTLSFCPMVLDNGQLHVALWPTNAFETLFAAVSRFPIIKHVRYYNLPSANVKGRWVNDNGRNMHVWDPPMNSTTSNKDLSFGCFSRPETQVAQFFCCLQLCSKKGMLETLTMPYCGNINSFCALPWSHMTIDYPMFPSSLRQVSINLMLQQVTQPIFDAWVFCCPNLGFLEISFSRPPEYDRSEVQSYARYMAINTVPLRKTPTKLKEIRLLADTSLQMVLPWLSVALQEFPALRKLALGHFVTTYGIWREFLAWTREQKPERLDLDVL